MNIQLQINEIVQLLNTNQVESALAKTSLLIKKHHNSLELVYLHAKCLLWTGKSDLALPHINSFLTAVKFQEKYALEFIRFYAQDPYSDIALDLLIKGHPFNNNNIEYATLFTEKLRDSGKREDAMGILRPFIEKGCSYIPAIIHYADIHKELENDSIAIGLFNSVLEKAPNNKLSTLLIRSINSISTIKVSENNKQKKGGNLFIITPVGPGHENLINECKRSIENAVHFSTGAFSKAEHIIIDDTQAKLGRSKARNMGINQSLKKGADWIYFIDADDLLDEKAFENVGPFIDEYDAIWGLISSFSNNQSPFPRTLQPRCISSITDLLCFDPFLTIQMGLFVKGCHMKNIRFNESLDTGEDFDFYLQLWRSFKCIKAPYVFFHNRRGQHSKGNRSGDGRQWRNNVENLVLDFCKENNIYIEFAYEGEEIKFSLYNPNDLIQINQICGHFFEIDELDMLKKHVPSNAIILDVGAHVGNHIVYYEKYIKPERIIPFEPNPENVDVLKKNIIANHLQRVDISYIGKGVGLKPAKACIHNTKKNNSGATSLSITDDGDIEVVSIDSLGLERVDFMKVAAEGMELDVLNGAIKCIRKHKPKIYIEVMNDNKKAFMDLVKDFQYGIVIERKNVYSSNYLIAWKGQYVNKSA